MTTQVQKVDGELIAFDHIASELPPASSEQYKWWLNQGMLGYRTNITYSSILDHSSNKYTDLYA